MLKQMIIISRIKKIALQAYLVLVLSVTSIFAQKVDTKLTELLKKQPLVTALLVMNSSADLSQATNIKGKNAKANFVYNVLRAHATSSQSNLKSWLTSHNIDFQFYHVTNMIKVKIDASQLSQLSLRADIKAITNDDLSMVSVIEEPSTRDLSRDALPEWGITRIRAEELWQLGFRGQNIIVGGQDTGYDWDVSPLKKKYLGYINDSTAVHDYTWHDAIREPSPLHLDSINPCGFDVREPCDDNNHGTHTMGTMVGSDEENSIGVAPDAKWIACRNMDRGYGSLSTYTECFEWFLAPTDLQGDNPDPSKAPHVINNSWGCPDMEGCNNTNWDIMRQAIVALRSAGTVVVVSAGNSGPNCETITSPAAIFDESFTIGASRINDTIANFSSRGPVVVIDNVKMKPDVAAPGHNVRSVIRDGEFKNFSGTSMAGPHVAGMVALLLSAHPELDGEVRLIEEIIRQSAYTRTGAIGCGDYLNDFIPNPTYGHGRVDVMRAHEIASAMIPEFAPIGAKWTYEMTALDQPNWSQEFVCIGTAILEGEVVKVIATDNKWSCTAYSDTIYIKQDLYKVYAKGKVGEKYALIYDFEKTGGETFTQDLHETYIGAFPRSYRYIYRIDSVSSFTIDNQLIYAQFGSTDELGSDTIISFIGSVAYFLPEKKLCDGNIFKRLLCYSAPGIDLKLTSNSNCDVASSVDNNIAFMTKIWPNPTSNTLYFSENLQGVNYKITNALGQVVQSGNSKVAIDIQYLNNGLYVIFFDNDKNASMFVVSK